MPGRSVVIGRPLDQPPTVNFTFFSREPIAYHHRDIAAQRRLVHDHFADLGWHVPALLAAAETSPDFYFDSLSQVQMPRWTSGRVTLAGDAAHCASPASGAGALLALVGAYRLAGELAADSDLPAALQRYEAAHRPLVAEKQAALFTGILVPRTQIGIVTRNLLVRSGLPGLLSGFGGRQDAPLADYHFAPAALA